MEQEQTPEPQTPQILVAVAVERLQGQGLIPTKSGEQSAQKILGGTMKSADWKSFAEAAVKKEAEDAQRAAN